MANVWSKSGCQALPMPWLKRPISTIGSVWWLSMTWKGVLFPHNFHWRKKFMIIEQSKEIMSECWEGVRPFTSFANYLLKHSSRYSHPSGLSHDYNISMIIFGNINRFVHTKHLKKFKAPWPDLEKLHVLIRRKLTMTFQECLAHLPMFLISQSSSLTIPTFARHNHVEDYMYITLKREIKGSIAKGHTQIYNMDTRTPRSTTNIWFLDKRHAFVKEIYKSTSVIDLQIFLVMQDNGPGLMCL